MPELPEVQTVVAQLNEKIVGKTLVLVWSDWHKAIRPSLKEVRNACEGGVFLLARRFGKHIVLDMSRKTPIGEVFASLVIHLKMTGHLLVKTPLNRESKAFLDPYNQFIHHRLVCSDDTEIAFSDMRKFGWIEALPTDQVMRVVSIASLGVDALSPYLTGASLAKKVSKNSKTTIGAFLLNQKIIAGIGNIYRSEALFRARVLPQRGATSIVPFEWESIVASIQGVLHEALVHRGMSGGDFRDTDGKPGEFQKELGVYGRYGKPCPKCATILVREKIGQRSVFFCPKCQS
jgi:formamidopyrimidine-DNA glycosylase